MLNGVYAANRTVENTFTQGKEYRIASGVIKFDSGTNYDFGHKTLSSLKICENGVFTDCSKLLDFVRPIKPKEILERLDTVEVYRPNNPDAPLPSEYVLIGKHFKNDVNNNWFEISDLDDDLSSGTIVINKIADKNGNVKWEREPKNNEVGNPVKWHEALLMAASGTPMCLENANDYMALNDNSQLSWYDKKTNNETHILEVHKACHWGNNWAPYTPKKMIVDWNKVPVDTDVLVKETESSVVLKRKFKCFVEGCVYIQSISNEDVLIKYKFTELAEPNDDYMKETE